MKRILIFILLIISSIALSAQATSDSTKSASAVAPRFGIHMSYLHDYTIIEKDALVTNVVRIHNNTDKDRTFNLLTRIPGEWTLLGPINRELSIAAHDTAYVPLRAFSNKALKGGDPVKINTSLYSEDILLSTGTWIVEKEIIHKWNAHVVEKSKFFLYNEDSSSVDVYFINEGNVDEVIFVDFDANKALEITNTVNPSFTLPVGVDTTITIAVKHVEEEKDGIELYEHKEKSHERFNLRISAQSYDDKHIKWQRRATFTKTKTEHEVNDMKWNSLPLTIDFQSYNILSDNPYASLGLYGMKRLDDERYLTYDVQMQGALGDYSTFTSNYQHFGYFSPKLTVELGDIGGNNNHNGLTLQGKGASVSKTFFRNHTLNALYTIGPKIIDQNFRQNMAVGYTFKTSSNRFQADLFGQDQFDKRYDSHKTIAGLRFRTNFFKSHTLNIGADGSKQTYPIVASNDSIFGYRLMGLYNGRFFKKLSTSVGYLYSTKDFVRSGGTNRLNANVTYSLSSAHVFTGRYYDHIYDPNVWYNGQILTGDYYRQSRIGAFEYRYRYKTNMFNLVGKYNEETILSNDRMWYGGGIQYTNSMSQHSRFNASIFLWDNQFNEDRDTYSTLEFKMGLRSRNFRINGIYYYGARHMSEHIDYSNDGIIARTYFLNSNYDYWTGKDNNILIDFNTSLNYFSKRDRLNINFRPTFNYYISHGFKVNAYAGIMFTNQGEYYREFEYNGYMQQRVIPENTIGRFEMGLGFTKDLGIPISKRNSYDVNFVAFVDNNANRIRERSEAPIPSMLIIAKKLKDPNDMDYFNFEDALEVITDDKGEATLFNLPIGEYQIETYPLEKTYSWFAKRSYTISVLEDDIVYLPQSRGGKIFGNLNLEVSDFSRFDGDVSVANIRVTAIDTTGFEYSTLTDVAGRYELNLPIGSYRVSINASVFTGAFELASNDMRVTLDNRLSTVQQNFFVKEKGRKMEVKKFGATPDEEDTASRDSLSSTSDYDNTSVSDSAGVSSDSFDPFPDENSDASVSDSTSNNGAAVATAAAVAASSAGSDADDSEFGFSFDNLDDANKDNAYLDSLSTFERLARQSMLALDSIVVTEKEKEEGDYQAYSEEELMLQEQMQLQHIVDSLSRVLDVDEAKELQEFFENENQ